MNDEKKEKIKIQIAEKKERLQLYLDQEKKMLQGGVQSYGLGSRNLSRYNTDLAQIRAAIKELTEEIEESEGLIDGTAPRRRVGLVFHDW